MGVGGMKNQELLSKCCRMCQRSERRHRTEGIIPKLSWLLSVVCHLAAKFVEHLWELLCHSLLLSPIPALHYWTNY